MKYRCNNCGHKVLVDATRASLPVTCPTCEQVITPPRRGRLWLEIAGGPLIFLLGIAIGHSARKAEPPRASGPAAPLTRIDQSDQLARRKPPKLPEVIASQQADQP
ncbi:MAG: hypothetical protein ACREIF_13410 [Chthoniobacterales bacterium]